MVHQTLPIILMKLKLHKQNQQMLMCVFSKGPHFGPWSFKDRLRGPQGRFESLNIKHDPNKKGVCVVVRGTNEKALPGCPQFSPGGKVVVHLLSTCFPHGGKRILFNKENGKANLALYNC